MERRIKTLNPPYAVVTAISALLCLAQFTLGCEVLGEPEPMVCSEYKEAMDSCVWFHQIENQPLYQPWDSATCEVCQEGSSCFFAFDDLNEQSICKAYQEDGPCSFIDNAEDQGWCFHLKEKKSCFMAMPDWDLRQECEEGNIPHLHYVLYY